MQTSFSETKTDMHFRISTMNVQLKETDMHWNEHIESHHKRMFNAGIQWEMTFSYLPFMKNVTSRAKLQYSQ